jgi:hypothetical protein
MKKDRKQKSYSNQVRKIIGPICTGNHYQTQCMPKMEYVTRSVNIPISECQSSDCMVRTPQPIARIPESQVRMLQLLGPFGLGPASLPMCMLITCRRKVTSQMLTNNTNGSRLVQRKHASSVFQKYRRCRADSPDQSMTLPRQCSHDLQ